MLGQHGISMADLISETPGRVSAAKIDLVAGTRSFIVGLGGALTGITAMMYTCGYLVTRAHLNLLGLYGLIEFNHDYILQEGAKFFLATAYSTGREILYPLSIVVPIILPLILLGLFLRDHARRGWDRLHSRLPRLDIERWLRVLAFVALFGALVEHSETYLDKFEHPLCFSNLLYTDADTPNCSVPIAKKGDGLRDALFRSDKTILDSAFHELAIGLLQAIILAYLTWRVTIPWRLHAWCIAPSFFATALYLILLPMDYGVLQRSINYPRIALTFDDKTTFPVSGPLFLMNKSAGDFVVWGAASRKLFWVPLASVRRAEVDGAYDLFDSRWRGNANPGDKK
jgi:hypothetical protein